MRKGTAHLRQSCLEQFLKRPGGTSTRAGGPSDAVAAYSLRPQRTLIPPPHTAREGTSLDEQGRHYATIVSDASSSSASASSRSKKRRKHSSRGTSSARSADTPRARRSLRKHSAAAGKRSSSSPSSTSTARSSSATSSTESYHSQTSASGRKGSFPRMVPSFTPAPHNVFLTPPESQAQKLANDALAYGQRSVVLPWSNRNLCEGEAGQPCEAWTIIDHILREDATKSSIQLCGLLQALLVHFPMAGASRMFSFQALFGTIEEELTPKQRDHFYADVLPWMKQVVCGAPVVFGSRRVPLLRQGVNERLVLRSDEALTLLCCAFFSLFPGRSYRSNTLQTAVPSFTDEGVRRPARWESGGGGARSFGISPKLAPINFDSLFSSATTLAGRDAHRSKIRCLLQYFMTSYRSSGDVRNQSVLEISRVSYARMPDFSQSRAPLQPLSLKRQGLIEDDSYSLQVDFANRIIGGGVLGRGCVQEEIRFVVSPELILSRLVCESLRDHEAIFISGCGQFSSYTGYASTFRFTGPLMPGMVQAPARPNDDDEENASAAAARGTQPIGTVACRVRGRRLPLRDVCVVAMDAVDFNGFHRHVEDQYDSVWVTREMQKAFVSFRGTTEDYATLRSVREGPVATGNWGCGAFGGDVELKLLIQWCAASEAGRPLNYYVFDRTTLPDTFAPVQLKLLREQWCVGDVVCALAKYAVFRNAELDRADADVAASPADPFSLPAASVKGVFEYLLSTQKR